MTCEMLRNGRSPQYNEPTGILIPLCILLGCYSNIHSSLPNMSAAIQNALDHCQFSLIARPRRGYAIAH